MSQWFASSSAAVSQPQRIPDSLDAFHRYAMPGYALLDRAAQRVPAQVACRYYDQSWTYEGLQHDVYRTARMFESLGIGRGDRVALLLPNVPEYAGSAGAPVA